MAHQTKKNLGVKLTKTAGEFRLWAPFANRVQIVGTFTPDGPIDLTSEEDGYWSVKISDVSPGHNYNYLITNGEQVLQKNDPRALIISSSDLGQSVVADSDFDWGDDNFQPAPLDKQIIYELHIGTFNRPDASTGGTFESAIEKLSYLKELGVTTIEVMPVTSMAHSNGWGYAPNHIFSVESMLGGRFGFLSFVKEAHKLGMGVILDVVYNHFSNQTDLWQFDGWSENDRGGIYFYNDERGDTPWGGRPDYGRAEVRQFILDNITMWLVDYRLDGLRIDSTIFMRNTRGQNDSPDSDIPEAWYLMQDITNLSHKIKSESLIIAEDCSGNSALTSPVIHGGCGFDSQWEIGFPHAIRDALGVGFNEGQHDLTGLQYQLEKNHNFNVFNRIIFSDSHDTAANGSTRLNDLVAPRDPSSTIARKSLLLASGITLTSPGIPMILQGSEFSQEGNFNDWQALDWDKVATHSGIVTAHRQLIDLRLNKYDNTAGLAGQYTAIFHRDDNNSVIGYHRWHQSGPGDDVIIIANFAETSHDIYKIQLPIKGTWVVRFNSTWRGYSKDFKEVPIESVTTDGNRLAELQIPALSILILSQDK